MTRVSVLPHRVSARGVQPGPWSVWIGGVEHDVATPLRDWNRRTPLQVRSQLTIDADLVRRECGLDADAPMVLMASWHSTATNIREVGTRIEIEGPGPVLIGFTIDPTLAAGTVHLVRSVVLARDHDSADPLAARSAGTVLWRDRPSAMTRLELQSIADRLTIEAIAFAEKDGFESATAWVLQTDFADPHRDIATAIRLLANTGHPAVEDLRSGHDDVRHLAESVLRWDIARMLIDRALAEPRLVRGCGGFAEGTVGGLVQRLLELYFPELGVDEMVVLRTSAPDRLEALLQSRIGMLTRR